MADETHGDRMNRHTLRQFEESTVLNAILEAWGEELDELTQAHNDLKTKRWIETGEGVQLDGIGDIVGQSRLIQASVHVAFFAFDDQPNALGFEKGRFRDTWESWLNSTSLADNEYRMALWNKVWKNNSVGTAEETIRSAQYIFNANSIRLTEMGNARIKIGIGRLLTANEISLAKAIDLFVRAGGVKLEDITTFSNEDYFGFLGQPNALGFEEALFADIFEY